MHGDKLTFVWPEKEDIVVADDNDDAIRNPAPGRRGTSFIFNTKVFGKLQPSYIQ